MHARSLPRIIAIALALVLAGMPVLGQSVVYRIDGFDFGPFVDGQNPDLGSVVGEAQVRERLTIIAPYTRWVRAFGSTNGLEHIGPVAHELGLQVACGAWLGRNAVANAAEIDAIVLAAQLGHCDMVIVGTEVLLRGDLSEAQLLSHLATVQAAVTTVPVTTADVYSKLLAHPAVIAAVDIVLANYYPFWEGVPLGHAVASLHRNHQRVVSAAGGKPVWLAETGWSSCGNRVGDAVPNAKNAAKYFLNVVSWARALGVPYFYFEALDESWKAVKEGPLGACWGVFDREGALKANMQKVFDGRRVADNWSGTRLVGGTGTPTITLTSVPPYGSFRDLKGKVRHVAPASYRVAVYIRVAGGWWTKPTFAAPLSEIWPDGVWTTDITTGGLDHLATDIAAFLVPATYVPAPVGGASSLPVELDTHAVASVQVQR